MEVSLTIWLWPPTPVTLATLSLEAVPGLVRVMECGVGHLQSVKVGGLVVKRRCL